MKIVLLILFIILMVPIYVMPWLGGLGTTAAILAADAETAGSVWAGSWSLEALCYLILFAAVLLFARGVRWTAALIMFAAVFDLVPVLDWVPLVPTVMLIIAFVFIAKTPSPVVERNSA